ncbi:DUF1761 domain-containing protein [Enhygromyxa salina]|uniref:DUF1761 domain-containing protein n=1 Tax=Enhygromyxa salina TaxID=215803 RepID=A0A2S9XFQ4_9BACT|nr:DUF1761 domain-containing protein [Enhygromyxa salina]PRP91695.1 hypothetical protein ENSA7_82060 [Enhygromyxa salina]
MDPSQINYLAVGAAALSSFLIGGLWYSPILFANAWMREAGLSEDELRKGVGRTFAISFLISVVIALNLAFFLGTEVTLVTGMTYGALTSVWVGGSMAITYAFERRSLVLTLIDAGYHAVAYTVMGAIIGAWH